MRSCFITRSGRPFVRRSLLSLCAALVVGALTIPALRSTAQTDVTPPVTELSLTGGMRAKNVRSLWWIAAPTISLSALDEPGGSGVMAIYYQIGDGDPEAYSGPFQAPEGIYNLRYWSVDIAGNVEAGQSQFFRADYRPMAATISASATVLWPANGKWVEVAFTGTVTYGPGGSGRGFTYVVDDSYDEVERVNSGSYTTDDAASRTATFEFTEWFEAARLASDRNGRTYTVTLTTGRNSAGKSASAHVTIVVPHDRHR